MNWQEVCADKHLHDLPYKIELNEQGQILMTPVRLYHSAWQGEIIRLLLECVRFYCDKSLNAARRCGSGFSMS